MKRIVVGFLLFAAVVLSLTPLFVFKKGKVGRQDNENLQPTFILVGDTGTGGERQYRVAQAIRDYCDQARCRAVFIIGDVIYNQGVSSVEDKQFILKFEKPYEQIGLPFYIAFGNHDYRGCRYCYLDYASRSEKWKMPAEYYRIAYPNVAFYVVNSEDFNQEQEEWLRVSLASNQSQWKVILGHRPLLTFEAIHAGETWDGGSSFQEISCNQADLYVSGHSHLLEDVGEINDCRLIQLISGGGGASPRKILKDNQDQFYLEGNGFLAIEISKESLVYRFLGASGAILHQKELLKRRSSTRR